MVMELESGDHPTRPSGMDLPGLEAVALAAARRRVAGEIAAIAGCLATDPARVLAALGLEGATDAEDADGDGDAALTRLAAAAGRAGVAAPTIEAVRGEAAES